jgi:hypothetical protein
MPDLSSAVSLLADWRRDVSYVGYNVLRFCTYGGKGKPPSDPDEDALVGASYLEVGKGWFVVAVGGDREVDLRVQVWSGRPVDLDDSWDQWQERRWSCRWSTLWVSDLVGDDESPALPLGGATGYLVRVAARGHLPGQDPEDVQHWLVQLWPLGEGDRPRADRNPPPPTTPEPLPGTGWLTWLEWTVGKHWFLYGVRHQPVTLDEIEAADPTFRPHHADYWDEALGQGDDERDAAEALVGKPLRTRRDMLRFLEAVGYLERSDESGIERFAVREDPSRVDDVLDARWANVRSALRHEGLTPQERGRR